LGLAEQKAAPGLRVLHGLRALHGSGGILAAIHCFQTVFSMDHAWSHALPFGCSCSREPRGFAAFWGVPEASTARVPSFLPERIRIHE
jgi:hypothetical protein